MNDEDIMYCNRLADSLRKEIYDLKCQHLALREYIADNIGKKPPEIVEEDLKALTKKHRAKIIFDLKKINPGLAYLVERGDGES
jgi:hypothetical protein